MKYSQKKIAVIGAGPSGIAAGRELLQQGFNNFIIYEKESAAGGTWHTHTYPGLACDVWAHSYTYSYAPNPNWSESFAKQTEIESYLQSCVKKFGLEPYIEFNRTVVLCELQNDLKWKLNFSDGSQQVVDFVINAMGNQYSPSLPNIKGLNSFKGESWHSTHWNKNIDLKGKRVIVIGSAASAVQIIPEIAPQVEHLTIMQRSPNWIVARNNKQYSNRTKKLFTRYPALLKLFRNTQGIIMNFVHGATIMDSKRMAMFENMGRKFIASSIDDPELQKLVTPKSRYGCKRPLVSDNFYSTLNRNNVTLLASGVSAITETGIISNDQQEVSADIIIFCTGYKVMDFERITIKGLHERILAEEMQKAPEAYKGIAVSGFPNYFLAAGPNALVLSVSYFKSIEANLHNIVTLMQQMLEKNICAIDADPTRQRQYNDWIKENCKRFSWGSGTCHNYYTRADGQSPFLYPADYKSFLKMRAGCTLDEFNAIACSQ